MVPERMVARIRGSGFWVEHRSMSSRGYLLRRVPLGSLALSGYGWVASGPAGPNAQIAALLRNRSFAQQVLVGAQAEFVDEVRMLGQ
jgi:hypothetical protein